MLYRLIFILLFSFFFLQNTNAQLLENFVEEALSSEWTLPVGVKFDDKGRAYVWEQRGIVYLLDEEGNKIPTPLINIEEEVGQFVDHGLLGFELHPNFYENGYFYLMYAVDRHYLMNFGTPDYDPEATIINQATIGRITRYTADPSTNFQTTIPGSRKVILGKTVEDGFPIITTSHGVGSLVFGEDGTLLASCGEGGSFQSDDEGSAEETYFAQALDDGILHENENTGVYRAQSLNSISGKIIRINPETGEGISSNPFYEEANPNSDKSKIWAVGFRNPYRFFIKPETGGHSPELGQPGHIFVGDVGANKWEETSVITEAGSNLGWPLYESFYRRWPFWWNDVPNKETPNPMFGSAGCQEHFTYLDVFKQPNQSNEIQFINPCSNETTPVEIPSDIPTYVHNRPILAWSNVLWNDPPRAFVGSFDAEGNASEMRIDSTDSPVEGKNFAGFSSLPGFFYEGENVPDEYRGALVQADYSGWIKFIDLNDNYEVVKEQVLHPGFKGITSLALSPITGEILYTNVDNQQIYRITYDGTPPPVIIAEADVKYGASPLEVQFTASDSYSPYGSELTYKWDFGNGETSSDTDPVYTFIADSNAPQTFVASLTATDDLGISRTKEINISLNNTPPKVNITSFEDGDFYPIKGITYLPLQAEVSDDEHSANELTYEWITYLHHNTHYHTSPIDNDVNTYTIVEPVGCGEELYWHRIELKVTDANGLSTSDIREIFPNCEDPFTEFINLQAAPNEFSVELDWQTAFENNVDRFEIQKAANVIDFISIGTVNAGAGNTYNFVDQNPTEGFVSYRIKAVDKEGIYLYSNEVKIEYIKPIPFKIYPNPTSTSFNIDITPRSEMIEFQMFDAIGKLVIDEKIPAIPTRAFTHFYSSDKLGKGVYLYRVYNGDEVHSGRLIIYRD